MQGRDARGRFSSVKNEIEENIVTAWQMLKVVPLLFILFLLYRYFDVRGKVERFGEEITCGSGCRCTCAPNGSGTKTGL